MTMKGPGLASAIPLVTMPENFGQMTVADTTRSPIDEFASVPSFKITNPWDRTSSTHYDAPTAYGLSYTEINTLVTGQISVDAADYWYTGVALPIRKISGQRISWNVMSFDNVYAERLPYESAPRIISSQMASDSDSIERRGIGFKMEHGFMKEEMGKEQYALNIRHMATVVSETINFGVLSAYFSCKNHNADYEKKHGYFGHDLVENLFKREVNQWCVLQKHENGFFIMDTAVSRMHGRYGVKDLDMYIMPEEVNTFLNEAEENSTYAKGGPLAVQNRMEQTGITLDNKKSGLIYGTKYTIFFTRTFYVDETEMGINPMFRTRQIGEYFAMIPIVPGPEPGVGYKTNNRNIRVYDEKQDNFVTLTLSMALDGVKGIQFHSVTGNPQTEEDIFRGGDNDGSYNHAPDGSELAQYVLLKPSDPSQGAPQAHRPAIHYAFDPLARFGELRREHFSMKSWVEMAKSFITKAAGEVGFDVLMSDFEEGLALVRAAKNASVEKYLLAMPIQGTYRSEKTALSNPDPDNEKFPFGRYIPTIGGVTIFSPESNFGVTPMEFWNSNDATIYMTNWPGLQFLANKRTAVDFSDQLNDATIKKIQKFVKAVHTISAHVDSILTSYDVTTHERYVHEFLDPVYTPSYFPLPSREAVMLSYFDEFDEAFPVWYKPPPSINIIPHSTTTTTTGNTVMGTLAGGVSLNKVLSIHYPELYKVLNLETRLVAAMYKRIESAPPNMQQCYNAYDTIRQALGIVEQEKINNDSELNYPTIMWTADTRDDEYLKTNTLSMEYDNALVFLCEELAQSTFGEPDIVGKVVELAAQQEGMSNAYHAIRNMLYAFISTSDADDADESSEQSTQKLRLRSRINNALQDLAKPIEKYNKNSESYPVNLFDISVAKKNFKNVAKKEEEDSLATAGRYTAVYPDIKKPTKWKIPSPHDAREDGSIRSTLTIGRNQLNTLFLSWKKARDGRESGTFFFDKDDIIYNVTVSLPGNYDHPATYDDVEAYLAKGRNKKLSYSGYSTTSFIDWNSLTERYTSLTQQRNADTVSETPKTPDGGPPSEIGRTEKTTPDTIVESKDVSDDDVLDNDTFTDILRAFTIPGQKGDSNPVITTRLFVWELCAKLGVRYRSSLAKATTNVYSFSTTEMKKKVFDLMKNQVPTNQLIEKKISSSRKKRSREESSGEEGGEYDGDENEEEILEKTIKKARYGDKEKTSARRIGELYPKSLGKDDMYLTDEENANSWAFKRKAELETRKKYQLAGERYKPLDGPTLQSDLGLFTRGLVEIECNNYENNDNFKRLLDETRGLAQQKLVGLVINLIAHARINVGILENILENDIIFPFGAIFLRPHQRYVTGSIIKTKAGLETGATYWNYKQNDFQEEDHVMDKTRIGSFTWESKSIVTNPMKVFIITDAICNGRRGGAGTKIFTREDLQDGTYEPGSNEYGTKDMFVALLPYEERYIPEVVDICGAFQYAAYPGFNDIKQKALHYSSAGVLNKFWKWRRFTSVKDYFVEFTQHTGHYGRKWITSEPSNTVCWRGFTSHFDHTLGSRVAMPGTGHFGNFVGQGFRGKRDGELSVWKPFDFSTQIV